jgi:osmoprotectant transport system ATP-binding protein
LTAPAIVFDNVSKGYWNGYRTENCNGNKAVAGNGNGNRRGTGIGNGNRRGAGNENRAEPGNGNKPDAGNGYISVLNGFGLEVMRGEIIAIIGRSGCGKTTMLKLVNRLIEPDSGKVYVGGVPVSECDTVKLRRNIGYVIQSIGLFPHLTVGKNISYVPSLSGMWNRETSRGEIARLMDVVGLEPDLASRYPSELSGGQCQRVGLARALAAKPEIMLMDEPFGAVDEITRRSLQDELLKLRGELNLTILFVTHDINEALKMGTRVLVMDEGRVAQIGPAEEIVGSPATSFVRDLVK